MLMVKVSMWGKPLSSGLGTHSIEILLSHYGMAFTLPLTRPSRLIHPLRVAATRLMSYLL
jgi:hypothetical protein